MKKYIAIILAIAMLITVFVIPGEAKTAYPESEHNYGPDLYETWEYVYPRDADGLYVTFDRRTYLYDKNATSYSLSEEELENIDEYDLREFIEYGSWYRGADYLEIYYGEDNTYYGGYTGDELAGATLYIPGNSFTLEFITNAYDSGWGFAITRISDTPPKGVATVNYHIGEDCFPLVAQEGENISLNPYYQNRQSGDRMLIGWQTEDGRAWNYNAKTWVYNSDTDEWEQHPTRTDIVAEAGAAYDLYPVWCPIGLRADEVYSFTNSGEYFDGGYFYTDRNYVRNIGNWMTTFGVTPFMPVAALGITYLSVYWPTYDFHGSCCGFPITELLQHYGKIDLLSTQGVKTVAELEPTDELTSIINVYNNNAVACHLVNNVALDPGSEGYTAQLRKLYATLEKGTPVYFEFYPGGDEHPMKILATSRSVSEVFERFDDAHGILLTGAYTASDGSHVLIACDCNSGAYSMGRCDTLTINEDFTEISYGSALEGFSWNDDVSQFDSFRLTGVSNPFAWHVAFFRHLADTLRQIFDLFSTLR